MFRILFVFAAILAAPVAAEPVVLVVGDSLSAGYGVSRQEAWPGLLQARLEALGFPHRVVNASITGDTTRGGLARLPAALKRHEPSIVVLELGGNDGLRGIPVEEIRRNLEQMIQLSAESGAAVVLAGMRIPPNYGPRYADAFHRVYLELAQEYGTGIVPFLLEGVALEEARMQPDGVHPTAEGQAAMLENVWPALEPLLDRPARLPSPAGDAIPAGRQS